METAKGSTREEVVGRLAERIDNYEKYAHPHSRLMAELASRLARRFGMVETDIHAITEAALLHDIGLLALAPQYHSSPRPLDFEERMDLWRHPIIGEQQMAKRDGTRHAQLLVRWHHEWWNGAGYPDQLAFEDIPIGARILRAVELYSALISARPYRDALDSEQAIEALKASAGIECDPYVVQALVAMLEPLIEKQAEAQEGPSIEPPAPSGEPSLTSAGEQADLQMAEQGGATGIDARPPAESYNQEQVVSHTEAPRLEQPVDSPWPAMGEASSTGDESRYGEAPPPAIESSARAAAPVVSTAELLLSRAEEIAEEEQARWRGWKASRHNRKTLLGFEASVLSQLEFRTIALPFYSGNRIDWYLKAWGKHITINDPRAWASWLARAAVEAREPLSEEQIARALEDIYIPRTRLANPDLRRWFGETDAWWMDNLRRNIESLDEVARTQAIRLGIQTGDYALSFDEGTQELRQPLTTVFWRLAGRASIGHAGHPNSRSSNQPTGEFIKRARVDLLYLSIPPSHADRAGAEARGEWRECWVIGSASDGAHDLPDFTEMPQSKQAFLSVVDRLLAAASHIRTWAIEYQEVGLASASDIAEVIKEHRPVRATYSKDVTEVAGGLRNYIIVANKDS